jgi:hypothetical protein
MAEVVGISLFVAAAFAPFSPRFDGAQIGAGAEIDGNPLVNVKDLRRVKRVMKDGRLYDVDALLRR